MFDKKKLRKTIIIINVVIAIFTLLLLCSLYNEWYKLQWNTVYSMEVPKFRAANSSLARAAAMAANEHVIGTYRRHYDSLKDSTAAVILVLVRRGEPALARLLASLERVERIGTALLVLSHGSFDEGSDRRARRVRFCRVIQLYYPYSVQLNPNRFPGPSARDCGEPDSDPDDCAPREARLVEAKHHWWWTANYVFQHVSATVDAPVIFLEDEHVVAPDALHMARLAARAFALYPTARAAALGRPPPRAADPALLLLDVWRPAYAAGLMFNYTVWRRVGGFATRFCFFDDTSWSQSLLNVFAGFPGGRVDVVAVAEPRVVASRRGVGGSGRWARARLFPARGRVMHAWARGVRLTRWAPRAAPAGGWADLRDQLFCLDPQIELSD